MSTPKYLKDANGFCYAYTPALAALPELTPHNGAVNKHGFASDHKKDVESVNNTGDTTDADVKGVAVDGSLVAQSAQPGVTQDDGGLSVPVIVTDETVAGKPRAPAAVEGVATDPNATDRHPTKPGKK